MGWNYLQQVEKVHTSSTLTQVLFTFACSLPDEQLASLYRDGTTMARKLAKSPGDDARTPQYIRESLLQAEMAADVMRRRGIPECTWWQVGRNAQEVV